MTDSPVHAVVFRLRHSDGTATIHVGHLVSSGGDHFLYASDEDAKNYADISPAKIQPKKLQLMEDEVSGVPFYLYLGNVLADRKSH